LVASSHFDWPIAKKFLKHCALPKQKYRDVFPLSQSFNGYESSTLGKIYVIKCDAIGNNLRNRLGTWEHVENPHWEHGGNTKIQRTPASSSLSNFL